MSERAPTPAHRLRSLLHSAATPPEPHQSSAVAPVAVIGQARREDPSVQRLDLSFFGLSEAEAEALPAGGRAALEVAWEALEDAGITDFSLEIGLLLVATGGPDRAGFSALIAQELALGGPVLGLPQETGGTLLGIHLGAQAIRDESAQLLLVIGELDGGGLAAVVLRAASEAVRNGDRLLKVLTASATTASHADPSAIQRRLRQRASLSPTEPMPLSEGTGLNGLLAALNEPTEGVCAIGDQGRDAQVLLLLEDPTATTAWAKAELSRGAPGGFEPITAHPPTGTPIPSPFRKNPRSKGSVADPTSLPPTPGYSAPTLDPTPPGRQTVPPAAELSSDAHVLLLSARSRASLRIKAEQLAEIASTAALPDLAGTLARRRVAFEHRLAVPAQDRAAAIAGLTGQGPRRQGTVDPSQPLPVAFVFSGELTHRLKMAAHLYDHEPVFRDTLNRCDALLRHHLKQPLLSVLFPRSGSEVPMGLPATDPALFAVQYALAELWRYWGITPSVVLGYGLGEYAAATVAGILRLDDAIALVAARGRILAEQIVGSGKMALVRAPERRVRPVVQPRKSRVAIAAIHTPDEVVISGPLLDVDETLAELRAMGIGTRALPVAYGLHSPHIDPALEPFEQVARLPAMGLPHLTFISSQTGEVVGSQATRASFWRDQLRQPVRFASAAQTLRAMGPHAIVEIGPRPALANLLQGAAEERPMVIPSMREGQDAQLVMLDSLARLWTSGVSIQAAHRYPTPAQITLPPYPWHRELQDDPAPLEALAPFGDEAELDAPPPLDPIPPAPEPKTATPMPEPKTATPAPEPKAAPPASDPPEPRVRVPVAPPPPAPGPPPVPAGLHTLTPRTLAPPPVEEEEDVEEEETVQVSRSRLAQLAGFELDDEPLPPPRPRAADEALPEVEPEPIDEELPEVEPEPIDDALPEVEPEPEPEPIDEELPEVEPEPIDEALPEVEPEPIDDALPEVEPEPIDEALPEVEPEPIDEALPEAEPVEADEPPSPDGIPTVRPTPAAEITGLRAPSSWEGAAGRDARHALAWEPLDAATRQNIAPGLFVLLVDGDGLGDYLASLLQEAGHTCVRVRPEPAFGRDDVIGIAEPADPESWAPLAERLAEGQELVRVLHMWSLDLTEDVALSAQFEKATLLGPTAISQLQSVLQRVGRPANWWAITRGSVDLGGAMPAPGAGLVHGAVTALGGGWVDLDPLDEDADALLDTLLSTDGEGRVALREDVRHGLRLRPFVDPLPTQEISADHTWLLLTPTDTAVLLAQQLTALGARHILLATPQEPAPLILAELESSGARIGIVPMELTEPNLNRLFLRLSMEQPVGGVVLAPTLQGTGLPHDPDDPWVHGALALHERLADAPVERFVCLIPSEVLLGGAPLDATRGALALELSRQRRADGLPSETWIWDSWPSTPADLRATTLGDALTQPTTALAVLPPGSEHAPEGLRRLADPLATSP